MATIGRPSLSRATGHVSGGLLAFSVSVSLRTPEDAPCSSLSSRLCRRFVARGRSSDPTASSSGFTQRPVPGQAGTSSGFTERPVPGQAGTSSGFTQRPVPGQAGTSSGFTEHPVPGQAGTSSGFTELPVPGQTSTSSGFTECPVPGQAGTSSGFTERPVPGQAGTSSGFTEHPVPGQAGTSSGFTERPVPGQAGTSSGFTEHPVPGQAGTSSGFTERPVPGQAGTSSGFTERPVPGQAGTSSGFTERPVPGQASMSSGLTERPVPGQAGTSSGFTERPVPGQASMSSGLTERPVSDQIISSSRFAMHPMPDQTSPSSGFTIQSVPDQITPSSRFTAWSVHVSPLTDLHTDLDQTLYPRDPSRLGSNIAADTQKPSCHLVSPPSYPHVFPCSTQTAVVTPQPGASQQIVLNFRDQGDGLALDGVPPEAVSQCPGECYVSQRVAKQIVLIFVNQPCESAKQTCSRSCGGHANTVNASTQTGGGTCHRTHTYRHSPPKSPCTFVRSRSCSTQTEWERKHEGSERSPVHANISPISHLVSQKTSISTQTECPYRVPNHSSSLLYTRTISQKQEAQGQAFMQGQRILTTSSDSDASSESRLGPVDTLTSSQAYRTRESEGLRASPLVPEIQDAPDHCLGCDRSLVSNCQSKVSNGSEDLINSPSHVFTHTIPSLYQETQPFSEEPMETMTYDSQTARIHGELNPQAASEKPMETTTPHSQTARIHDNSSPQPPSKETTATDCQTARIHGDPCPRPSCKEPMENTTSDGQSAIIHGDLIPQSSNKEVMETTTSDGQSAIIHGDLIPQSSNKEVMETTTCDGQADTIHGDPSPQLSSKEPIETTSSDGQTARIHGDSNLQPSSNDLLETTTSDGQNARIHGDPSPQPSSKETTPSDGQTAIIDGNPSPPPYSKESKETTTSDGQTTIIHADPSPQSPSKELMETTTSDGQTARINGDVNTQPSSKEPMKTTTSDGQTARVNGDSNPQPFCKEPMETTTSNDLTDGINGDPNHLLDTSPHIPCQSSHTQTNESKECVPGKTLPGEGKVEATDNPALKSFGRCGAEPKRPSCSSPSSDSHMPCGTSCLPPSLNQYLDNLLEQHRMSLNDPVHHQQSQPSSSSLIPCAPPQPHVRQIILNFLEKESRPVSVDFSSISSRASSSLSSMAGHQIIPSPGSAGDKTLSLIGSSESQDGSSLDSPLTISMPGDQDVMEPGDSEDLLSTQSAGDQEIPKSSDGSDLSSSQQLTSKPLSQDVGSPGTALSLLVASMAVNQDISGCDSASDTLMTNRPEYRDVPEPRSTNHSPSPLLNKPASQDARGFSGSIDFSLSGPTQKPGDPDATAPDTSGVLSSSALMTNRPAHQDLPDPQGSPLSKPERQDSPSPGTAGDSSMEITSMAVTRDVSGLQGSPLSKPERQDSPSPGTAGDSSMEITSMAVTRDVSGLQGSPSSKPERQDSPSPGTAGDSSMEITSMAVTQDASGLQGSPSSKPERQDSPSPCTAGDSSMEIIGMAVIRDVSGPQGSPSSKPERQDSPSPGTAGDSSMEITGMAVTRDVSGLQGSPSAAVLTSKPARQDFPSPGTAGDSSIQMTGMAVTRDVSSPPGSPSSKPEHWVSPSPGTAGDSSIQMTCMAVTQDVSGPQGSPYAAVLTSKPERQDSPSPGTAGDSSMEITGVEVTRGVSAPGAPSDVPASDSSPVLASRPANPASDSPLTRDVSSSDTTQAVSSHITSMPVSEDVPGPGTLIRRRLEETQTPGVRMKSGDTPEDPLCQPQRPPKSRSCPALVLEAVTSSVAQEVELRLPAAECEDLVEPPRSNSGVKNEVTFEDIAVYFSREEWEVLEGPQKGLYCQVMMDNYRSLISLGVLLDKPGLISRIEDEEAELWEDGGALGVFGGDHPPFPTLCTPHVRALNEEEATQGNGGGESAESSSHLGALMRLVNEIPGFLLGGSSPGQHLEDAEIIRSSSEVKMEESSPSCTPVSIHTQRVGETPESSSPGAPWGIEKSNPPASAKAEEVEMPIHPPYRHSQPSRPPDPPHPPSLHIKSEPGACTAASPSSQLHIKQEEIPVICNPAGGLPGRPSDISSMKIRSSLLYKHRTPPASYECHPPDSNRHGKSSAVEGDHTWTSLPAGSFPRISSVSPASLSDGSGSAALRDLHIKIKQEDSGSDRDPAESPLCGRKVLSSPMAPSPSVLEQLRPGASPRRTNMDRRSPRPRDIPPGKSHLHGLVNCLKEISASRLWAQPQAPPHAPPHAPPPGRCAAETDRSYADPPRSGKMAAPDPSSPSRVLSVLWRPPDDILKEEPYAMSGSPNPFTVAVTNGSARLRGAETKMAESFRMRADPPAGGAVISGKCQDRVHTRPSGGQNMGSGGFQKGEEPRRAEMAVKRTHSDDPSRPSGGASAAKRPALDSSPSRVIGTLWIPPDDGKCPLMSVRNCVRKIPSCWAPPPPPMRGSAPPEPCHPRLGTHGGGMPGKLVEVKEEKSPSPIPPPTRHWIPPPGSPIGPDQSGTPSTNVHLSGLMRLMEEIPVAESSSSSRTMYSIAIGHSMTRRPDRTNFLSYYNDDGNFQAELNDNTVASVDSVYSDDTSLSSDNLDPSYSAIGGLQRVVSEFAELGSVSPLVALSVPPSASAHEGQKIREPSQASTPRLNDAMRGSQRGTPVSAASVCSAEDGEAAYAALCGLQKVVHGFNEQECVSPFLAVRSAPHHGGLRESLTKRGFTQEDEGESPRLPDSSLGIRFLCEASWMSKADSSYSALSGLQKVVNGFSDLGCVSPFSAVSTSASESAIEIVSRRKSEQPTMDVSGSALSGLKKTVNGVPESCASPAAASSNPSSVGEPDPGVRRRNEHIEVHSHGPSKHPPRSGGQCIDLTQEEEPAGPKARTPNQGARNDHSGGRTPDLSTGQAVKPTGGRVRPPASGQLIDLTEEDETPARHRAPSSEAARRPPSGSPLSANPHKAASDRKMRTSRNRTHRVSASRPLDPGPSGGHRGGIPAVNEHISGLEKLLKGVPTFTPPNTPSGQRRSGSWWFKSTSPHET
ncbi:uncharacterized protein ACMZJ9_021256 [Mantella aurantiaca]